MGRNRTLTDLIADVRQRTNQEESTFVTDAEITEYLNQALAELWSRLTQGGGQSHYRAQTTIAVEQGTSLYSLPADFWVLQGVEATLDGITGPLTSFMPLQRGALTNPSTCPWGLASPVRYRVQGDNIEFLPATETFDATVFYTPSCPRLVGLTDTFGGFNGYEVAAIYDACATVLAKEESDPSFYAGQRDRIYRHIESLSGSRDMSQPERVQNVISYGDGWDTELM